MNIPIYDGRPTWNANALPFGFYNQYHDFQVDCVKVAEFVAIRLGYPLVDIELQSGSIFTAFEEAITVYGNELYSYLVRDNMLTLEGFEVQDFEYLNDSIITPNLGAVIKMSEQYGAEAGTGGNVPWYTGAVILSASVQDYDLKEWAKEQGITGSIEIKRVFYQEPVPASAAYLSPMDGFGFGGATAAGITELGGFGGSTGFMMMPLHYDMQVIQSIEMNEMIRMSNYSFEMHNNVLRVFPLPGSLGGNRDPYYDVKTANHVSCGNMWFEYIKTNDRISGSVDPACGTVSNVSNMPYTNPNYDLINSIGRQWIFEYTLALCKEILGYVRGKYGTIPIPNADITLNQSDLLGAATAEKTALLERLRAYFDETSRSALLARRAAEKESRDKELDGVPTFIYIG
jgi:hypothetical protein|tara:strand:- start:4011 stop:5213 length:1203 start_codon:yes stop_codon:yes gene_type:complete